MIEIGENGRLWKRTSNHFTESKIIKIDLDFAEKLEIEVRRIF